MNYNLPFFQNPFFWILLSSIFAGASISKITTFTKRTKNPEKAKNRKWILVCIYFSLALIFFTCSIFLPGKERFLDIRLLWLFAGATPLAFLIFRFKKAAGLPVLLLLIFLSISLLLFFQSILSFTGETEIAIIRTLDVTKDLMKIEVQRTGEAGEIVELEGQYFSPVVKVIIFEDWMVFLGAKTWYRFVGFSSSLLAEGEEIPIQTTRYHFKIPGGISEDLYRFFEKNEGTLPGVKSTQISMEQKLAKDLSLYRVMLQNDGAVQIVLDE